MSDKMRPIPFSDLMNWVMQEYKSTGFLFGVRRPFYKKSSQVIHIFNEKLEMPFGPAAGPHTQLAQNIIASYFAGSRFFELKTVQIIDGDDLPVNKPCILAVDECYNCEWSTELRVTDAFKEYVKAWFALKVISKEFGLGREDGFIFNMSVGYDYVGITSPKIDTFIEGLMDASNTSIWKECQDYLLSNIKEFQNINRTYIEAIPARICNSVTVSTLHGCPPLEIEKIASYLIAKKHLNTLVKCNPTLLGYEFARRTMDKMGYDYVSFGDFHFKDDLQYGDAVPMFQRLMRLADENHIEFGVKITNTLPVDVKNHELPSQEMYMSGRALFALSITLASRLSKEFNGNLRISYSGGADAFNILRIYQTGIAPITMATTILKPGGYQRMSQIAKILEGTPYQDFHGIDCDALDILAESAVKDSHLIKQLKSSSPRKLEKKVPLINCFIAPCQEGCPIHQDIPTYVALVGEGRYLDALKVITLNNPFPFITGTLCSHRCMTKCTRNFYEEPVQIRSAKLKAAEYAISDLLQSLEKPIKTHSTKIAVIGGGPAGLAAAYFLAKEGFPVTVFEKKESLGGIVKHVIPEFRITAGTIQNDIHLIEKMGMDFQLNTEVRTIDELKRQGYGTILLATGAWKPGFIPLNGERSKIIDVLNFLEAYKKNASSLELGQNVVIIGGGNTAMDAARAAKRVEGVTNVAVVYRRTKRDMPAEEEELALALKDEIEIQELLIPISIQNRILTCHKVTLGEVDLSGRRMPVETDEVVELYADTVIYAAGEKVDTKLFQRNGITVTEEGKVDVDPSTLATNLPGVYVIGDARKGPATIVEAIADAACVADVIVKSERPYETVRLNGFHHNEQIVYAKRGVLAMAGTMKEGHTRCLECSTVCECCVEVCPNRANLSIDVEGYPMKQIIHIDGMCNECGNCEAFCPYNSRPYHEKFTLFYTEEDFADSKNPGFVVLDFADKKCRVRLDETVQDIVLSNATGIPKEIVDLINTVLTKYMYVLGGK